MAGSAAETVPTAVRAEKRVVDLIMKRLFLSGAVSGRQIGVGGELVVYRRMRRAKVFNERDLEEVVYYS
jgi:hypothetical protein